jgi:hypothetical protein
MHSTDCSPARFQNTQYTSAQRSARVPDDLASQFFGADPSQFFGDVRDRIIWHGDQNYARRKDSTNGNSMGLPGSDEPYCLAGA